MADKSAIEWTDATWTPIRARFWEIQNDGSGKERIGWHCEHVSEGCRNCYAEGFNRRLGTGRDFKPGELYREEKRGYKNGEVKLFLDEQMLTAPLRWKKPRMIFVCSMTDLFADFVPDQWIDKVFAVMALAKQHTFQVLTKRAKRMREYFEKIDRELRQAGEQGYAPRRLDQLACDLSGSPCAAGLMEATDWPLPNVWLGVSAERQQEADERIPELLATPAAVRFVSAEPLLGPINIVDAMWAGQDPASSHLDAALDWIIAGGESGPGARPMHPAWARSLRDQCQASGTAFFFKQWGAWAPGEWSLDLDDRWQFSPLDPSVPVHGLGDHDRAQHRIHWWDDDKAPEGLGSLRLDKKAAGRLLDGVEHNAMPDVR